MKSVIALVLVSLMFCLGQFTLAYYYPERVTNYFVWTEYIMTKDKFYDFMFFLIALVLFWNTNGVLKAVSCFFLIMTWGSFVDKVIFGLNQYLWVDIVLFLVAAALPIYLYIKRWKKLKSG